MSVEDDLETFRREFAEMNERVQKLSPDDLEGLAAVRGFLEERRAAPTPSLVRALADAYYLEGMTADRLGQRLGKSHEAVSAMLRSLGPTEYLAVRRDGERYEQRTIAVSSQRSRSTRSELIGMREQGWRIVPATWQVDPATADMAELWERLGDMSAQA